MIHLLQTKISVPCLCTNIPYLIPEWEFLLRKSENSRETQLKLVVFTAEKNTETCNCSGVAFYPAAGVAFYPG